MSRPRASNHGAAPLKYQEPANEAAQGPQPVHRGDPHDWWSAICRQEILVRFLAT